MIVPVRKSLDELIKVAAQAKDWKYSPTMGAYGSYRSEDDKYIVTLAHFGIPKGFSAFQKAYTWYNDLRNRFLSHVPLFGLREEIMVEVVYKQEKQKSMDFSSRKELFELYFKALEEVNYVGSKK
jgi:hypothetical protein